jgi:hypothetical protein
MHGARNKHNTSLELMCAWYCRSNCHRVVGYGPFSLCVIHKEGLCPSSGDINRLMMKLGMEE